MRHTALILFLLFSPLAAQDSPAQEVLAQPDPEEIRRTLQAAAEGIEIPALGVAIVVRGEVIFREVFAHPGEEDFSASSPCLLGRRFSDLMLGLALIRLQEEGNFRLQDRLDLHLASPALENPWASRDPVRISHLMEHTAGLEDVCFCRKTLSGDLRQGLTETALASRWPPGSHFSYSAWGSTLAALAAAEHSGRTPEELIRTELFQPLNLANTRIADNLTLENCGIRKEGQACLASLPISTSLTDLSSLLQMFTERGLEEETPFLSEEALRRLETPRTGIATRNGLQIGYGLGNDTVVVAGHLFHGMNDAILDLRASLRYLSSERLGYALLLRGAGEEIRQALEEALAGMLVADLPPVQPPMVDLPPNRLVPLSGYYRPVTMPMEKTRFLRRLTDIVYLRYEQDRLYLEKADGDSIQFFPVTDRRFRAQGEPVPTTVFFSSESGLPILAAYSREFRGTYLAAPGLYIWVERILGGLAILLLLTSPMILLLRPWRTKSEPKVPAAIAWLLPPLTALIYLGLAAAVREELQVLGRFGDAEGWSLPVLLLFVAAAAGSVISWLVSLYELIRTHARRAGYLVAVSSAACLIAGYLYIWMF